MTQDHADADGDGMSDNTESTTEPDEMEIVIQIS